LDPDVRERIVSDDLVLDYEESGSGRLRHVDDIAVWDRDDAFASDSPLYVDIEGRRAENLVGQRYDIALEVGFVVVGKWLIDATLSRRYDRHKTRLT